jgi:hypothetical protein
MNRTRVIIGLAVCMAAHAALPAAAAEPLAVYLSAPAAAAVGQEIAIEALIFNRGDKDRTFTYAAEANGLTADKKTLTRRVWIAPKACLPVRWTATAPTPGEASFALTLDGRAAKRRTIRIIAAKKAPIVASVLELRGKRTTIELPEPGANVEVEITITAGARGELAATLDGLRQVPGFNTNAIVARRIAPAALGDAKTADLALLAALQHASGGWGPTPMDAPSIRTTSWVTFWLGHLARAGGDVDAKMLTAAMASLRKSLAGASPEMQTRILTALAANGKATQEDLALIERTGAGKISRPGRLLAASAGAALPLPLGDKWDKLSVLETSALVLCLARTGAADQALPQLARLAKARGPQPTFDTHEAALYALGLRPLAGLAPNRPTAIRVKLGSMDAKALSASADKPFARLTFTADASGERKPTLTLSRRRSDKRIFCRIIVRPAD